MKRLFRFVAFLIRAARARLLGYELMIDMEEAEVRQQICDPCPFNKQGFCQECGCFVDAKTLIAIERCPKGKWNSVWKRK